MTFGTMLSAANPHAANHAHAMHDYVHGCAHHHPVLLTLGILFIAYLFVRLLVRAYLFRRFGGGFGGYRGCHGRRGFHDGGHGYHGGCHRGWGRRGFRGSPLAFVFDRLETSAAQEKVIREAVDTLRAKGRELRAEGRPLREGVARAFEAEVLDPQAIANAFESPESRVPEMRRAFTQALAEVHAILTPDQRKTLASMLVSGPRFGFGRS